MRFSVSDVVSPSYFIVTAAVELGFLQAEGIDAEFVYCSPEDGPKALADGRIDCLGASPYIGLFGYRVWRGGKLLCALSQHRYWFLAVRADLGAKRGDMSALRGLSISAGGTPGLVLRQLLEEAGM